MEHETAAEIAYWAALTIMALLVTYRVGGSIWAGWLIWKTAVLVGIALISLAAYFMLYLTLRLV